MYMQRSYLAPAPGKGQQLEEQVSTFWKAAQATGRRVTVGRRILSSDGPMLSVTTFAEELADLDRMRRESMASAEFQAHAGKVSSLLREPVRTYVGESVITAGPRAGLTISVNTRIYPALGKDRQVLSILEELVQSGQSAGVAMGLWRRIFSSDGSGFLIIGRYADLGEFDRVRKERAQITREAAAAVSELSRAPISQLLIETVVPLPT